MSAEEHRNNAPKELNVGVVTISDTRSAAYEKGKDEDESGQIIQKRLGESNYSSERSIIPDEKDQIEEVVKNLISDPEVDAVITTGGTGIASRDKTIQVIRKILEKELPGFGESLRRIGYEKVGGAGLLTRATAGVSNQVPIFCLPGTPNAVKVGMDLIIPDLAHIVKHARE